MLALTLTLLGWLMPARPPAALIGTSAQSPAANLTSVTVAPTSVIGGTRATATITLSAPAPTGGVKLAIASNHPAVKLIDANGTSTDVAFVREGQSTAQVFVATSPVPVGDTVRAAIAVSSATVRRAATLAILPPGVRSLSLAPTSVTGGATSTATVTLTGPAPNGGAVVAILATGAADNVSLQTPFTIAAGQATGQLPVTTAPVASQVQRTLIAVAIRNGSGAALVGGSTSGGATLTVLPPVPNTFTAFPPTTRGVANVTITLQLTGSAPAGGMPVSLSSSHPNLIPVPASATVAAGQTGTNLTTQTRSPDQDVTVTLRATAGGVERTATVLVRRPL